MFFVLLSGSGIFLLVFFFLNWPNEYINREMPMKRIKRKHDIFRRCNNIYIYFTLGTKLKNSVRCSYILFFKFVMKFGIGGKKQKYVTNDIFYFAIVRFRQKEAWYPTPVKMAIAMAVDANGSYGRRL